jgi:hypothetical protein
MALILDASHSLCLSKFSGRKRFDVPQGYQFFVVELCLESFHVNEANSTITRGSDLSTVTIFFDRKHLLACPGLDLHIPISLLATIYLQIYYTIIHHGRREHQRLRYLSKYTTRSIHLTMGLRTVQLVFRMHNLRHNLLTPKIRLATKLVRTRYSHSNLTQEHTPKSQQNNTSSCIHEMVRKTRTMESNQMPALLSLDPLRPHHRSKGIGLSNLPQKHLSRVFKISSRGSMQKNEKGRS